MSDPKIDFSRTPPPVYADALLLRPEAGMIRLDFLYVQKDAGIAYGVGHPVFVGESQLREMIAAMQRHLESRTVIVAKGNDTPQ